MKYEYTLIRSKSDTFTISVKEGGEVVVRAPEKLKEREIEEMLQKKSDWIEKAVEKQKNLGENRIELSKSDIAALKKLAEEVLPARTEYFAKLMGVDYKSVKITYGKKQFGCCNSEKEIRYSYRLMLYPPEAVDYVVVHELSHTVYFDHSKNFYNFIARFLPDYKERKKLLKGKENMPPTVR